MDKTTKIIFKTSLLLFLMYITTILKDRSVFDTYATNAYNYKYVSEQDSIDQILNEKIKDVISLKDMNTNSKTYSSYLDYSNKYDSVVGWIKINQLVIDYPIMFSGDNFYLDHDINGNESIYGSIYLDEQSDGILGRIGLIHGHNMKDGRMFGELDKFKSESFTKEHRYLEIADDEGTHQYKIFSVFITNGDEEIKIDYSTDEEYESYFDYLKKRSLFKLDSNNIEKIIILNTCSYEFPEAHLLVCAYEI